MTPLVKLQNWIQRLYAYSGCSKPSDDDPFIDFRVEPYIVPSKRGGEKIQYPTESLRQVINHLNIIRLRRNIPCVQQIVG